MTPSSSTSSKRSDRHRDVLSFLDPDHATLAKTTVLCYAGDYRFFRRCIPLSIHNTLSSEIDDISPSRDELIDNECHIDVVQLLMLPFIPEWARKALVQHFGHKYPCGHRGPYNYELEIRAYGERLEGIRCEIRCPTCAAKHIHDRHGRCFLCHRIILPGSAVLALETGREYEDFSDRTAFLRTGEILTALACDRMGCGGVTPTGTWNGTHYKDRETKESRVTFLVRK